MAASRRYGEDLRSIGQALEARDIIDFELKRLADLYVIQGIPEQGSLRSKVRQWLRRLRGSPAADPIFLGSAKVEQLSKPGERSAPTESSLRIFAAFRISCVRSVPISMPANTSWLRFKKGGFRSHCHIGIR